MSNRKANYRLTLKAESQLYDIAIYGLLEQGLEYLSEQWEGKYFAAVDNWRRDWDKVTTFFLIHRSYAKSFTRLTR